MLTRTKPHLLASDGEQGKTAQAVQNEMVSHMSARVLLVGFKIRRANQRRVNTLIYWVLSGRLSLALITRQQST